LSPAAPSENREARRTEIVGAALRLLEEGGLDRLSLRGVARELGMHAPGLYWYIESRQELIDLLAKAILDEAVVGLVAPVAGQGWDEWLTDFAMKMREALLAHRDGARVVAGAFLFRTNSITGFLELMEQAMAKGSPIDAERWPRVADVMSRWFQAVKNDRAAGNHTGVHFKHGLALVIAGLRSMRGAEGGGA
jgi:AcrR family transcriptional regulator